MRILVTGAAGYIGGTFCSEMLKKGFSVLGCDNFSNSTEIGIRKLQKKFPNFFFKKIDLCERKGIYNLMQKSKVDTVAHFAALKSVPVSEIHPEKYWKNNVDGTKNLLKAMSEHAIRSLIYSSSAAVYGNSTAQPVKETYTLNPKSVYGKTKVECENLIQKWSINRNKAVVLRYFNPLGSHKEKFFIDNPFSDHGNVISSILKTSFGKSDFFPIFGDDYDTTDGSGERDYIHVADLIEGHFAALLYLEKQNINYDIFNLGTGRGCSVKELVKKFEEATGLKIKTKILKKRKGDLSVSYADCRKSNKILGWKCKRGISEMCFDAYDSVKKNLDEL